MAGGAGVGALASRCGLPPIGVPGLPESACAAESRPCWVKSWAFRSGHAYPHST